MPSRGGSRPKATAARPHSPAQTRRKHARFPDQHGHICSPAITAETALTRNNDGQIPDGHDVAGHQGTHGLATGARRRGGPGGPGRGRRPTIAAERSMVPRSPGFSVSSAGECPKTHDFVYK